MNYVDVFVRMFVSELMDPIRRGMQNTVIARWSKQPDARVTLITNDTLLNFQSHTHIIKTDGFHMKSKAAAEKLATTPIYVIADDDCLPLHPSFIAIGVKTLESYPEYAMVSPRSIIHEEMFVAEPGGPLRSTHGVGGIVFVRKGILTEFKMCDADKIDGTLYDEVREKGLKVGVVDGISFNHLGFGYSQTSKQNSWGV